MPRLAACVLALLSFSALAQGPRHKVRKEKPDTHVPRAARIVICGPPILGKRKPDTVILVERKELPMRPIPLAPASFRAELPELR